MEEAGVRVLESAFLLQFLSMAERHKDLNIGDFIPFPLPAAKVTELKNGIIGKRTRGGSFFLIP